MLNPFLFTIQNFLALQKDFIGFRIDSSFFLWILSFVSVCFLFCLLYLLGICIRQFIFRLSKPFTLQHALLSLALGYIFFCTGVTLLGVFSSLSNAGIIVYLIVIIAITILGIKKLPYKQTLYPLNLLAFFKKLYRVNTIASIFLLLFLVLGVMRLLSPEIGVDAIYYHYDYPTEYLRIHSLMEFPKGSQIFLMTPQLAQMLYVIMLFFHLVPSLRIIHFFFFLCAILVFLYIGARKKITQVSVLPALLFTASPTVLGLIGSGYADTQWIFLWTLIFSLLVDTPLTKQTVIITAILFGGLLASKIQGLSFFIIFICFLVFQLKRNVLHYIVWFIFLAFAFPSLWYIRSLLITGQIFYASISTHTLINLLPQYFSLSIIKTKIIGLFINFNPFILISIALALISFLYNRRKTFSFSTLTCLNLFLVANYLILPLYYYTGRYLLFAFSIFSTLVTQLPLSIYRNKYYQITLWSTCIVMFGYYFINATLILPYGLTWANTNHYLTRVLARNNASYYDFDMLFSPYISTNDLVGTYTINGFLYANFTHEDVFYVLKLHGSFTNLKKAGISKLLIKHGDIQWFCTLWELTDCSINSYKLLAVYPPAGQYLYKIR